MRHAINLLYFTTPRAHPSRHSGSSYSQRCQLYANYSWVLTFFVKYIASTCQSLCLRGSNSKAQTFHSGKLCQLCLGIDNTGPSFQDTASFHLILEFSSLFPSVWAPIKENSGICKILHDVILLTSSLPASIATTLLDFLTIFFHLPFQISQTLCCAKHHLVFRYLCSHSWSHTQLQRGAAASELHHCN